MTDARETRSGSVGSPQDIRQGFQEAHGLEEVAWVWRSLSEASAVPLDVAIPHFEDYLEKLARYATTLCVFENGDLVGAASYYANDVTSRRAYLSQFAVASAYKRQGWGRRILEEVCRRSSGAGMLTIDLEVNKSNDAARCLYERCGFEYTGAESAHSLFMRRTLS